MKNKVLVLTGFSGAGKDAVAAELRTRGYTSVIPHTTRPMRVGEKEGDPYHYISLDLFCSMIANDEFIEYNSYKTMVRGVEDRWYYGTSCAAMLDAPKSMVNIGVQSSVRFKKELGGEAILILLTVPDAVREERAITRGSFDKQEWDNRLAQDTKLRNTINLDSIADVSISNTGTIEQTADSIIKFIENQG